MCTERGQIGPLKLPRNPFLIIHSCKLLYASSKDLVKFLYTLYQTSPPYLRFLAPKHQYLSIGCVSFHHHNLYYTVHRHTQACLGSYLVFKSYLCTIEVYVCSCWYPIQRRSDILAGLSPLIADRPLLHQLLSVQGGFFSLYATNYLKTQSLVFLHGIMVLWKIVLRINIRYTRDMARFFHTDFASATCTYILGVFAQLLSAFLRKFVLNNWVETFRKRFVKPWRNVITLFSHTVPSQASGILFIVTSMPFFWDMAY